MFVPVNLCALVHGGRVRQLERGSYYLVPSTSEKLAFARVHNGVVALHFALCGM